MKPAKRYLNRKVNRIKKVVLVLVVLIAGNLLVRNQLTRVFIVRNVEFEGEIGFTNTNDLKRVVENASLGKNILTLNTKSLEYSLKDTFLSLSSVETKKRLPNTLIIKVNERDPFSYLEQKDKNKFYLVDRQGYVLGAMDVADDRYPVVQYVSPEEPKIGSFLPSGGVNMYVDLLDLLSENLIEVKDASLEGSYIRVTLKSGTDVLFSIDRNTKDSVELLKLVLKKYSVENQILKRIDVRYDNVVVE